MNKEILPFVKAKNVWLYGAGKVGSRVAREFSQSVFPNKVRGIAVTQKGAQEEAIEGYPVCALEEITTAPEDTLFLITVSAKYQPEVMDALDARGYKNYIFWNDSFRQIKWYLTEYGFYDRKRDADKVCFVLSGYKEFLWDKVFARLQRFVPQDVEVCILSSGLYSERLEELAGANGWSYLHTALNDLTLIQNIAISLYDKAQWIYKMDEDMFLTENCFEKLFQMYRHVQEHEPYHVGFVGPLIPLNGFGYRCLLEHRAKLEDYEEKFGKAYWGGLLTHELECNPEAAKYMWGAGGSLPHLDTLNREMSENDTYSVCGVRYSIGFILYHRDMWELMDGFSVTGEIDMGRDERDLCYWAIIKSHAMIIACNTVVGHFSFGPQTAQMKEFYLANPEYFTIREADNE